MPPRCWRLKRELTTKDTKRTKEKNIAPRRKGAKGKKNSDRISRAEESSRVGGEETVALIKNAAGIILGVTENRAWIELIFEGDLMHTKTVNLPGGSMFDIYIETIPHKTTVYEHPRTMIFFDGPCDLEITRDGNKVIVMGSPLTPAVG
jgi:hypothetical protein